MTEKPSIYDLRLVALTAWLAERSEPPYRAKQIFQALYRRRITAWEQAPELPKALRDLLAGAFALQTLTLAEQQKSTDGTVKWLLRLGDAQLLETVLIPADTRNTVCVSTQVGCAYACAFCASGLAGFKRNLSPGEIVQQILIVERTLKIRISNIVFMGMGEPLANYENLLKAIRILNDPEGLKIGARKITISTVGLVPKIERLAKEDLQIELAISLHAPNDELRNKLMPVNKKHSLKELLPAIKKFAEATKRLITFEYILIDHVNDAPEQAEELGRLLKGMLTKVNLIPCHPIPGAPWGRPSINRMVAFERTLRDKGVFCTLRRSRGLDIEGACGQLRLRYDQS